MKSFLVILITLLLAQHSLARETISKDDFSKMIQQNEKQIFHCYPGMHWETLHSKEQTLRKEILKEDLQKIESVVLWANTRFRYVYIKISGPKGEESENVELQSLENSADFIKEVNNSNEWRRVKIWKEDNSLLTINDGVMENTFDSSKPFDVAFVRQSRKSSRDKSMIISTNNQLPDQSLKFLKLKGVRVSVNLPTGEGSSVIAQTDIDAEQLYAKLLENRRP